MGWSAFGFRCLWLWDWLRGEDPARVQRVTVAAWQMKKLDLAKLKRAAGQ
jgi:hypothetical protein